MQDLPFLLQFIQSSERFLKRRIRVRPVDEHHIDMIRLQIHQ